MPEFERLSRFRSSHLVGPAKPDRATSQPVHATNTARAQQQAMGNQAAQRFARSCALALPSPGLCPFGGVCHTCPARVQAKLKIGQPGDKYEQEADRVAEQVMRMPEPPTLERTVVSRQAQGAHIQRVCMECDDELRRQPLDEEEEEETLQTKEVPGRTSQVTLDLEGQVNDLRGNGQPLPESIRAFFEPRFGYDFSRVRAHVDTRAAESARAVNARAYTVGSDIVFGAGQYEPETRTGQRLLAHELTHVMQQKAKNVHPSGATPVIQLQPVDCTPAITGVAPPRDAVQEITEAHNLAVEYARIAQEQVETVLGGGRLSTPAQHSLNFHFGNPGQARLRTIRDRYRTIRRRLAQGTGIYRCNLAGYCRAGDTYAAQVCPADGYRTRICPPFFSDLRPIARAGTLVHEAAHAAGICNHPYIYEANYPGTNPANNAESYGEFARSVGGLQGPLPMRPHVPTVPPAP